MDSPPTPDSSRTPSSPPSPKIAWDVIFAQLNSSEARSLRDTIDGLSELGICNPVVPPQIIVIGAQSSGKSAVLEAISRVRFPVGGDICTRFVTELVFRPAPEAAANISIQFADPDASHQPFQRSGFDHDALPAIIKEAKELMGICEGGGKKFSKDILRVESRRETAEQDRDDKETVGELIESYVKQSNSIILAVVAANSQLANQEVLQKVMEHDPNQKRTIGVITNPDMAGRGSANEKKYLNLAKGRGSMHKLDLGWGVESLRKRVSKVLFDRVKAGLPRVIEDIETGLQTRQQELDRLGNPRSTPEELRAYLLGIAEEFKHLSTAAIEGRYGHELFGGLGHDETGLAKLRAVLRRMNWAFETVMETKGASYKIKLDDSEAGADDDEDEEPIPQHLRQLIDAYGARDPVLKYESELNAELQELASINQGREFSGDANPELALLLFKKRANPWRGIARKYIDSVLAVTKAFVYHVFTHLVGAGTTTWTAILDVCVDPFFAAKKIELEEKLQELLLPFTNGSWLPLEKQAGAKMRERTLRRLACQLADRLEDCSRTTSGGSASSKKEILHALRESENPRFGTEKVIDVMTVHYEMSLRVFMDNVINLAVESCLVRKIPTILTPLMVNAMEVDKLTQLVAESEEVRQRRQVLQEEVRILREGLSKCQKHKPREVTMLPGFLSCLSLGAGSGQALSRAVTPQQLPTPARDSSATPAPAQPKQPTDSQTAGGTTPSGTSDQDASPAPAATIAAPSQLKQPAASQTRGDTGPPGKSGPSPSPAPAATTPLKPSPAQHGGPKAPAFGQPSVPSPPPAVAKFLDNPKPTVPPSKPFADTSRTSPLSKFAANPGPSVLKSGSSTTTGSSQFSTAPQPSAGGTSSFTFGSRPSDPFGLKPASQPSPFGGSIFAPSKASQPPAGNSGLFGGSFAATSAKPAAGGGSIFSTGSSTYGAPESGAKSLFGGLATTGTTNQNNSTRSAFSFGGV